MSELRPPTRWLDDDAGDAPKSFADAARGWSADEPNPLVRTRMWSELEASLALGPLTPRWQAPWWGIAALALATTAALLALRDEPPQPQAAVASESVAPASGAAQTIEGVESGASIADGRGAGASIGEAREAGASNAAGQGCGTLGDGLRAGVLNGEGCKGSAPTGGGCEAGELNCEGREGGVLNGEGYESSAASLGGFDDLRTGRDGAATGGKAAAQSGARAPTGARKGTTRNLEQSTGAAAVGGGATPTPSPRAANSSLEPKSAGEHSSADEVTLLVRARRLLHAQPARALELTDRHVVEFPRGVFAEERELLAIEALHQLGRHELADQRIAKFKQTFPTSAHRARVEALRSAR